MTLEQEEHLQQLLAEWRDERHLSIESQRAGLMGSLCEEMAEYYRATNESEKIDALCDTYVFCMNSIDVSFRYLKDMLNGHLKVFIINTDRRFFLLSQIERYLKIYKNIKIKGSYAENDFHKHLYILMKNVENEAQELGYNFYKCMLETIKEISSRTGHYDKNIHKFVKDKSDEAVKKWYKADYSKCRIKG